jgi:hypothetical protein
MTMYVQYDTSCCSAVLYIQYVVQEQDTLAVPLSTEYTLVVYCTCTVAWSIRGQGCDKMTSNLLLKISPLGLIRLLYRMKNGTTGASNCRGLH